MRKRKKYTRLAQYSVMQIAEAFWKSELFPKRISKSGLPFQGTLLGNYSYFQTYDLLPGIFTGKIQPERVESLFFPLQFLEEKVLLIRNRSRFPEVMT